MKINFPQFKQDQAEKGYLHEVRMVQIFIAAIQNQ